MLRRVVTFPPSSYPLPPPPLFPFCSIAAESARAVAAAEGHVRASRIFGFVFGTVTSLQVRALELEAAEAKRDAGDFFNIILAVT